MSAVPFWSVLGPARSWYPKIIGHLSSRSWPLVDTKNEKKIFWSGGPLAIFAFILVKNTFPANFDFIRYVIVFSKTPGTHSVIIFLLRVLIKIIFTKKNIQNNAFSFFLTFQIILHSLQLLRMRIFAFF